MMDADFCQRVIQTSYCNCNPKRVSKVWSSHCKKPETLGPWRASNRGGCANANHFETDHSIRGEDCELGQWGSATSQGDPMIANQAIGIPWNSQNASIHWGSPGSIGDPAPAVPGLGAMMEAWWHRMHRRSSHCLIASNQTWLAGTSTIEFDGFPMFSQLQTWSISGFPSHVELPTLNHIKSILPFPSTDEKSTSLAAFASTKKQLSPRGQFADRSSRRGADACHGSWMCFGSFVDQSSPSKICKTMQRHSKSLENHINTSWFTTLALFLNSNLGWCLDMKGT